MCSEPVGSSLPYDHDCPHCGGEVDVEGYALDVCPYSPVECEKCGSAPCDQYC